MSLKELFKPFTVKDTILKDSSNTEKFLKPLVHHQQVFYKAIDDQELIFSLILKGLNNYVEVKSS